MDDIIREINDNIETLHMMKSRIPMTPEQRMNWIEDVNRLKIQLDEYEQSAKRDLAFTRLKVLRDML